MENKEMTFKTNLNCANCVSKIQSDFDNAPNISEWKVDTENPDKLLHIKASDISQEEIIKMIRKKGFTAEVV